MRNIHSALETRISNPPTLSHLKTLWLNGQVRIIYLSPHLDDAVLSAGGLIRKQTQAGNPVEIWSFMAGVPDREDLAGFATTMHKIWGYGTPAQAVAIRRAEDQRGAAAVGAKAVHFDFLDCIYRRGKNGEGLYPDAELPIHPEDAALPARIAEAIKARLEPDDRIVCQLAVGGHVDHVIVRRAAEMLQRPLLYDADMPYVLNHPDQLPANVTGMQESLQPVSQEEFKCWIEGIECYATQVPSVFGGWDRMRENMQATWEAHKGVRLWSNKKAGSAS